MALDRIGCWSYLGAAGTARGLGNHMTNLLHPGVLQSSVSAKPTSLGMTAAQGRPQEIMKMLRWNHMGPVITRHMQNSWHIVGSSPANRHRGNGQIWLREVIPGMALAPEGFGASTHVNAAARQNTDRDGSKSLGFLLRSGLYNLQQAHAHAPFPASCALLLGPD
jgi:hypothetical protein